MTEFDRLMRRMRDIVLCKHQQLPTLQLSGEDTNDNERLGAIQTQTYLHFVLEYKQQYIERKKRGSKQKLSSSTQTSLQICVLFARVDAGTTLSVCGDELNETVTVKNTQYRTSFQKGGDEITTSQPSSLPLPLLSSSLQLSLVFLHRLTLIAVSQPNTFLFSKKSRPA